MANTLPIRSLLICDDIRQERNGKLFLIGVYPGRIESAPESRLPFFMPLSIFIQFDRIASGKAGKLEIFLPEQRSPTIDIDFDVAPESYFAAMQFENFVFPLEGSYKVLVSIERENVYETSIEFGRGQAANR